MAPFLRLILVVLGAAMIAIFVVSWSDAQGFKDDLTAVGFANVDLNSPLSNEKAIVEVHGCKLGIDNTGVPEGKRTVSGREMPLYSVNSISGDTWTAVPELRAKASTPDEVAAFLAAHTDVYTCYKK